MSQRRHTVGPTLFASLLILGMETATPVWAQPEPLTIAAANSLRDAFRKILPLFEARHPEFAIRVVYGPSQTLRMQIEQGAPVDVFLPSSVEEIDRLELKGLVIRGSRRVYAATSLTFISGIALPVPVHSIEDLKSMDIRRIAIGDPKTSSVGRVAAQFLKSRGLEPKRRSQYVFGPHSRAVVDLVAGGEADVGIVYRTDAVTHPKIHMLDIIPAGSSPRVHYGVAAVWTAINVSGTETFMKFLSAPHVQNVLQELGFDRVKADVGTAQHQEVGP